MTCGVYKIIAPDGEFYVGASRNIERRFRSHRYTARRGKHASRRLQGYFDAHGEEMKLKILIVCRPEDREMYEQACLDLYQPTLNTSKFAGNHAARSLREHTMAERAYYESLKGNTNIPKGTKFTREHLDNISRAGKGRTPWNKGRKGLPKTEAQIRAVKERMERPPTEATLRDYANRKGRIPWNKGRTKHEPKTGLSLKMSLSAKARCGRDDPETRQRKAAAMREAKLSKKAET